jgi:hypothetical protein
MLTSIYEIKNYVMAARDGLNICTALFAQPKCQIEFNSPELFVRGEPLWTLNGVVKDPVDGV